MQGLGCWQDSTSRLCSSLRVGFIFSDVFMGWGHGLLILAGNIFTELNHRDKKGSFPNSRRKCLGKDTEGPSLGLRCVSLNQLLRSG